MRTPYQNAEDRRIQAERQAKAADQRARQAEARERKKDQQLEKKQLMSIRAENRVAHESESLKLENAILRAQLGNLEADEWLREKKCLEAVILAQQKDLNRYRKLESDKRDADEKLQTRMGNLGEGCRMMGEKLSPLMGRDAYKAWAKRNLKF